MRVVIFGASGLAGNGALRASLADARVTHVLAVTRRPLAISDAKLEQLICTDFLDLSPLAASFANIDACFFCLGVSASIVKTEHEYRTITHGYALAAARALYAQSPAHAFHFLSGQGTNATSRAMWRRIKGETENDLRTLGLHASLAWRPALILADSPPTNISALAAFGYRIATPLVRIGPLRAFSIEDIDFGRAMLQVTIEGTREGVLENRDIRAAAGRYNAAKG